MTTPTPIHGLPREAAMALHTAIHRLARLDCDWRIRAAERWPVLVPGTIAHVLAWEALLRATEPERVERLARGVRVTAYLLWSVPWYLRLAALERVEDVLGGGK